jgi:transposase InsO family protein
LVEAIPTGNATNSVVINFLEENILVSFGFPRKIITNNARDFKSVAMIKFCQKYNIILGHSASYYTQGNGLAESSNKSLMRIIEKVLTKSKNSWHMHLKYSLWANMINTKKSIGMSHFQLVYGTNVILPINVALPVMKLWQDVDEEPNDLKRRINQII